MPDCNGEVRKKMTETVGNGYAEEIEACPDVGTHSVPSVAVMPIGREEWLRRTSRMLR